jgi:hypothetical protein
VFAAWLKGDRGLNGVGELPQNAGANEAFAPVGEFGLHSRGRWSLALARLVVR